MGADFEVLVERFLSLFEILSTLTCLLLLLINLLRSLLQFILKYRTYISSMIVEVFRRRLLDGVDASHDGAVAVQNVILLTLSKRITRTRGHSRTHHISAHSIPIHVEWIRTPILDLSPDALNGVPVLLLPCL